MSLDVVFEQSFEIEGGNFSKAGRASGEAKRVLKEIGLPPPAIRRASIAMYEAEMNIVAYARTGTFTLWVTSETVHMRFADEGQGIVDIDLAMQEGYSTADNAIREMGFGAGMGLPNIKRNTDRMEIRSEPGVGTTLDLEIDVKAA